MHYLNQLEPQGLVSSFLGHPPVDFQASLSPAGVPVFTAKFDLLTTADKSTRRIVTALPLYRFWGAWLRPRTCFVGTTVSEYALFNPEVAPRALIQSLKETHAKAHLFLIIKDIPQDSPLLDSGSNRYAAEIVAEAQRAGFVILEGQALAYLPIDFSSIDEYYKRLSYKGRKDVRRKLRSRAELTIETVRTGSTFFADRAVLARLYQLYCNVYEQSEIHFDLLSREFFEVVLNEPDDAGIVFIYRHRGELIGFNLCFKTNDKLVDKYVGFAYPRAREMNLYFVSWVHNIEYALTHDLKTYVAGWTDPEIKARLGASFTFTRHAIYVRNPLLRAGFRLFARRFESDRIWHEGQDM